MPFIRKVTRELEARLEPPQGEGSATGKLERKWYADGGERLKVRVRIPGAGALQVRVVAGGRVLGEMRLDDGSGELEIRSEDTAEVPHVEQAEVVEVRSADRVFLEGVLEPD